MENPCIDLIIPVYKPDASFRLLLQKLQEQTFAVHKLILANTGKELWEEYERKEHIGAFLDSLSFPVELFHVEKENFDHGGTRRLAVTRSDAPYFVCMTQDAMPQDEYLLEHLLAPFLQKEGTGEKVHHPVALSYARQVPRKDCRIVEQYTRAFNYPKVPARRTKEDLPRLGIKTIFCSDVCAAYSREIYEQLGGFEHHAIFNEDTVLAGHAIIKDYAIAYAADALVIHSHNYSALQQYHRNFDLAVSQKQHPEVFAQIRSESEGIRMVKKTAGHLFRIGKPWLLFGLVWQSGWKYLGYRDGKRYELMGRKQILRRTMNPGYWESLWKREEQS